MAASILLNVELPISNIFYIPVDVKQQYMADLEDGSDVDSNIMHLASQMRT